METGEEWGGHDEDAGGWKDSSQSGEMIFSATGTSGSRREEMLQNLPVERVPPCLQKRAKNGAERLLGVGQFRISASGSVHVV